MKAAAIEIRQYFKPVVGTRPWRAKLGVGSFLTFEFGSRIKADGHLHGQWHLWIYLANWTLFRGDRQLVDSDSDRKFIKISIQRLTDVALTGVDFDSRTRRTTFLFNEFRLVVSSADYLTGIEGRDYYWIFLMPNDGVLAVGPTGIHVEPGNIRNSVERKKQEVEFVDLKLRRQISLED
jgi:hypothetical protein